MATILAAKSGPQDSAIAKSDDHHEALASDPAVSTFPQGSSFGGTSSDAFNIPSSGPSAFGAAPATDFGSTSSFGSPAPAAAGFGAQPLGGGIGSNTGFGASASGPAASGATQMTQQNQAEMLKSSGGAMQEGAESSVKLDKDATDWINKKMRPMMGWIYMLTCTCDFVIFPVLWSVLQAVSHGSVTSQWQPLTLQGAGLYHIAMGAVLGIAAYGRTKEKVAGVA
jgi:Holin of 3TMs, for gene-transfer release